MVVIKTMWLGKINVPNNAAHTVRKQSLQQGLLFQFKERKEWQKHRLKSFE